jgi:hypothetical protein
MPRKKKTYSLLEKTEQRVIGFKSIDSNLDFGNSMSLNYLTQLTTQLRNQIDKYNMMLNDLDSAKAEIEIVEKTIGETLERLISGVVLKYGKDSREYEMIGGVRKSDRIRKATITRIKSTADSKAAST